MSPDPPGGNPYSIRIVRSGNSAAAGVAIAAQVAMATTMVATRPRRLCIFVPFHDPARWQ
jgi:hypothetical protein